MILNKKQKAILKVMRNAGKMMMRKDIVSELKIPRTTVFDNLNRLKKNGIVEIIEEERHIRGRPRIYWKLVAEVNDE